MNGKKRGAVLLSLLLAVCLLSGCWLTPAPAAPTPAPDNGPPLVLLTPTPEAPAQAVPADEPVSEETASPAPATTAVPVSEDGEYDSRDDVALYLHLYGHLPSNFIGKKEAQALGWPGGSLDEYAYGKCIGGDYFGNYEGLLPRAPGRTWHECDIDTLHARSRGAKRLIWSNDGLIYYTGDHYESFTLLYGEE